MKLNDGHSMPPIAYGTGTVLRDKDVSNWITQAVKMGFSHIDTAQMYNNETSAGDGIRRCGIARQNLFVTTKYLSGSIQEAIRLSLRKLDLDYVDLYLIHAPYLVENDFEGAWRQFEKIKEDGLARSIGISNFDVEQLQDIMKIAKIKPVVNQISLNPYNYASKKSLLEYASQHGIIIEAYNILASITQVPGGPADAPVNSIAKRLGISPGQVLLLWAKAKGVVIIT
ncbi:NAD/NADP-dependent indole-3-acetaldehyde reductase [Termitomyces sp. T112]|nr:NAD/NADP-dependent indole-3-acetaldehyde reductase [Termitomyces sp. T112]